jgi:hypothetical protein
MLGPSGDPGNNEEATRRPMGVDRETMSRHGFITPGLFNAIHPSLDILWERAAMARPNDHPTDNGQSLIERSSHQRIAPKSYDYHSDEGESRTCLKSYVGFTKFSDWRINYQSPANRNNADSSPKFCLQCPDQGRRSSMPTGRCNAIPMVGSHRFSGESAAF